MTEKQSLYALLGLSDKASPQAVYEAFPARRQALDVEPESEEKHTRIAIPGVGAAPYLAAACGAAAKPAESVSWQTARAPT